MDDLRQWLPAIGALVSSAATLWLWISSPAKAAASAAASAAAAAAAVGSKVNDLERRLDRVEFELKHLPDSDDIQKMAIALESLKGSIKTLEVQVQTAVAVSEGLRSWLLEQGK